VLIVRMNPLAPTRSGRCRPRRRRGACTYKPSVGQPAISANVLRWLAENQWTCVRKSQLRSTPMPNE
jgi:hypothetical protein